ncbi:MAG: hydrolase, partial [Desulfobacca sp.]|nr:hydrolase [Desulfobacca sp.]
MNQSPDRQAALVLLRRYNPNEALIHHALAVEAVMRYL